MSESCGPVEPAGMVGSIPGFGGGTNAVADRVLYTTGVAVR